MARSSRGGAGAGAVGQATSLPGRTAGWKPAPRPWPRPLLLDGRADQVAVLGPAAIVVADVLEADEVAEHEPRVTGPLADAAVGDRRLVRVDALLLQINGTQLVQRL